MKSKSVDNCIAISVSLDILEGINTPYSRFCASLLKSGNYTDYLKESPNPGDFDDPRSFFDAYISANLLSKFPNFALDVDRDAVAMEAFLASESACKQANLNLTALRRGKINFSSPLAAVFHSARVKIGALLGPFNWDSVEHDFGFGPGACIGLRRRQGDSYYKFGHLRPTSTEGNLIIAETAISRIPRWRNPLHDECAIPTQLSIDIVKGNRVTTVPKDAKKNRVIAIEPMLNMFIQKGIGASLRRKLKRVGVNLDSQQLNQELARKGSLDGTLATIDLKSASDTVSLALVEDLLPTDWVEAIKRSRSPYGVLPDGSVVLYRKVSSMGNGFTFELESLIFWALTTAVMAYLNEVDRSFAVYGDDIVVPSGCSELLLEVLAFAGFTPNKEKTFTSGPFRESCGKHYFRGFDVTPLYIRNDVRSTERKLWLANSIRRLAYRLNGSGYGCDSRLLYAWGQALTGLPAKFRKPRVPLYIRDGVEGPDSWLAGDFDESKPRRARFGLEGFEVDVLIRTYKKVRGQGNAQLLKSLFFCEKKSCRANSIDPLRWKRLPISCLKSAGLIDALHGIGDGVGLDSIPLSSYKHRVVRTLVPQWGDAGPWTIGFNLGS